MDNDLIIKLVQAAFEELALGGPDPMTLTKRQALWTLWPAVEEIFDGPKDKTPRRAWSFRAKIAHRANGEKYPDGWRYMECPLLAPTQLDIFRQVAEFTTYMIGTTPPEMHQKAAEQRTRGLAVSLSRRGGVAPQHWSCEDGEGGAFIIRAIIARGDWQEDGSIAHQYFTQTSEAFPDVLDSPPPHPYDDVGTHKPRSIRIKRKESS